MVKGIALLQICVCSEEGKPGNGFKALSRLQRKRKYQYSNQATDHTKNCSEGGSHFDILGWVPLVLSRATYLCCELWSVCTCQADSWREHSEPWLASWDLTQLLQEFCSWRTEQNQLRLWGRNGGGCCIQVDGDQAKPLSKGVCFYR